MNSGIDHDPAIAGEIRVPMNRIETMPMNMRKIIAKRCALELEMDSIINLGIGVPEGIALVALEEGIDERLTMTIEAGFSYVYAGSNIWKTNGNYRSGKFRSWNTYKDNRNK